MKHNRTFIQVFALALSLLGVSALASSVDRSSHGATSYPIWSELSYFERSALGDLWKAHAGEPDAMLALYLVASGSRELEPYQSAKQTIDAFVAKHRAQLFEHDNAWLAGKLLNLAMHESFFTPGTSHDAAPAGYDVDQSRLLGIFENGEFNCISSSLLYAVLARHFDLTPLGVFLPSHAFIQLNLDHGRAVDVETTSPRGFDLPHDAAFYERMQDNLFSGTRLRPATYEDYMKRERVGVVGLAARNMFNQHTAPKRMTDADRSRLAEISAFIDPGYELAQEQRLYFYTSEIRELSAAGQWPALARMFAVTAEQVVYDAARHPAHERLQVALQLYLAGAAVTYAHLGDAERTLHYAGLAIDQRSRNGHATEQLEIALSVLLSKLAEQNRYDDAVLIVTLMDAHLAASKSWPSAVLWLYSRWAEALWRARDWTQAADVLHEYLTRPHVKEGLNQVNASLATIYTDWVVDALRNNDRMGAEQALAHCQAVQSSTSGCTSAAQALQHGRSVK